MSTSLQKAATNGDVKSLIVALECSACNIDAPNASGRTALMISSAAGHIGMVRALCEAGADVTVLDGDGQTAQMLAAAAEHAECAALLLREQKRREEIWNTIFAEKAELKPTPKVPAGDDIMAKLLAEAGLKVGPAECPF